MRENHIRHGDLHAENILVAEDGQKNTSSTGA